MAERSENRRPAFDASPGAAPLWKEKLLWILLMGGFFFMVYGSTNQISALTAPHPSFYWLWEQRLPFVPELVLPYMSSDLFFVLAFMLAPTRSAIQKLGLRCGLAIVISAAFFLLMPLQFSFARPEVEGWPAWLFAILSLDQPYNQFPSLHISLGFICWRVIDARLNRPGRLLAVIWFCLIGASTVLVFQHHFVDILGGIAVVYVVHRAVPTNGEGWLKLRFVTPRHLHLSLRYLVISIAFIIAAFIFETVRIPLAWLGISMLLLAAAYCLAWNEFLRKSDQRHDLASWALFWPYLLASWVNWRLWRTRVPSMVEVQPGVWIGARPSRSERHLLAEANIKTVIDLVPELPSAVPEGLSYIHIPLLDVAIPEPAVLERISGAIETAAAGGNVYIHCALGMSRSVLAACAWLMANGHSKDGALALLDRVQPHRVKRPYMSIALDLLEDYRSELTALKQRPAREER